jgi:hypothetical protein
MELTLSGTSLAPSKESEQLVRFSQAKKVHTSSKLILDLLTGDWFANRFGSLWEAFVAC